MVVSNISHTGAVIICCDAILSSNSRLTYFNLVCDCDLTFYSFSNFSIEVIFELDSELNFIFIL